MALIQAPWGTSQVKGSLGSTVFQQTASGLIVRQRTTPTNPGTPGQNGIRQAMAQASARWISTLTAAQRTAWESYAEQTPLPNAFGQLVNKGGRQMYLRTNVALIYLGQTPIDDAPTTPGVASPIGISATGDTTDGIEIADPTVPSDTVIVVRLGQAVSQAKNYYKAPFLLADFLTPATVFPLEIKPAAEVAVGQRYFIAYRTFQGNGKVSVEQKILVDITA